MSEEKPAPSGAKKILERSSEHRPCSASTEDHHFQEQDLVRLDQSGSRNAGEVEGKDCTGSAQRQLETRFLFLAAFSHVLHQLPHAMFFRFFLCNPPPKGECETLDREIGKGALVSIGMQGAGEEDDEKRKRKKREISCIFVALLLAGLEVRLSFFFFFFFFFRTRCRVKSWLPHVN